MKTASLIMMLLLALKSIGQIDRKLTIDYKLFLAENAANARNNNLKDMIARESGNLLFKLYISDSISYYTEKNGINGATLSAQLAMSKSRYISPIYCTERNTFLSNNDTAIIFYNKNEYLIEKNGISSWEISNQIKVIDGYICYKATASDYYYYSGEDIRTFEITAYFCPELPFAFGPVYYGNLPGLILEINYLDVRLVATKILYEVDETKIVKPIGEKSINFDEYNISLNSMMNRLIEKAEMKKD